MTAPYRRLTTTLLLASAALTLGACADSPTPQPQAAATGGPADPGATSADAPRAADGRQCTAGAPVRLRIPALGVDAPFERIGLDTTAKPDASGKYPLGNPKDRRDAGWYAQGPQPGSGRGTVLVNGHTYRDGSAIFTEDFAKRVQVGQRIDVVQDNGSTCSYAVQRAWPEVDAQRDYPRIVTGEKLYDFSGPERLFLETCGGSWNAAAQNYNDISMLIATPVGR